MSNVCFLLNLSLLFHYLHPFILSYHHFTIHFIHYLTFLLWCFRTSNCSFHTILVFFISAFQSFLYYSFASFLPFKTKKETFQWYCSCHVTYFSIKLCYEINSARVCPRLSLVDISLTNHTYFRICFACGVDHSPPERLKPTARGPSKRTGCLEFYSVTNFPISRPTPPSAGLSFTTSWTNRKWGHSAIMCERNAKRFFYASGTVCQLFNNSIQQSFSVSKIWQIEKNVCM